MQEQDAGEAIRQARGLLESMPGRRKTVLAILDYLREARTPEDLRAQVGRIQEHDSSAFSAGSYCALLEQAGAIERLACDGGAWDAAPHRAELVESEGARYYRPAPKLRFVWRATQAGLRLLAENDPADLLAQLIKLDAGHTGVYERILGACAGEGLAIARLNEMFDEELASMENPLKTSHFVGRLEDAGALEWNGLWHTTPAGRSWLDAHDCEKEGE